MMEDKFGLGAALQHAAQGHQFSLETLMKMNIKLDEIIKKDSSFSNYRYDFMKRLTSDQRQKIYQDAQNSLEKYMKTRKIDRPKSWSKELMKAYHVLKLLKRNLGFDILTFTRLENKLFEKGPGIKKLPFKDIFVRHHFRNSIFRKLSLNSRDLILTNEKLHNLYRAYSEAEIIVIIEGFAKMMNMKGSGIGRAITRGDMVDIFRGNEWVINGKNGKNGWFENSKFQDELDAFNERRDYLKSEGSDEFIDEYYNSAYNRFYLNFPHEESRNVANGDSFYSLVEPHPWLGDLKMFIDIDLIGYARIDVTNEYWDFFLR